MLDGLFDGLIEIVQVFATLVMTIFDSAIGLIYDVSNTRLTTLGYFVLIGLGTGLLIWGFNFIRKLIRIRRG